MESRIETLNETRLIGTKTRMSFAANKTRELWQTFMPHIARKSLRPELYSVEIYPPDFFKQFNPTKEFEKWAAVEAEHLDGVPKGTESLILPQGKYAVFIYKGKPSEAAATYQHIYSHWLPASPYDLDTRPHFALMGDKYIGEDPSSEEEIWIPVKERT